MSGPHPIRNGVGPWFFATYVRPAYCPRPRRIRAAMKAHLLTCNWLKTMFYRACPMVFDDVGRLDVNRAKAQATLAHAIIGNERT